MKIINPEINSHAFIDWNKIGRRTNDNGMLLLSAWLTDFVRLYARYIINMATSTIIAHPSAGEIVRSATTSL